MPNLQLSTESSQHQFRYFGDLEQLRRNPLAKQYFRDINVHSARSDIECAVTQLRAAVFAAAERCRTNDSESGDSPRALRRFEIIRLHYIERLPVAQVALLLKISLKHCYRERAAIQQQIGDELFRGINSNSTVVSGDDDYFVLLSRLSETEATVANQGFRAFEYLQRVAESPYQKIAALQALGFAQLSLGMIPELEGTYHRSERLRESHTASLGDEALDLVRVAGRLLKAGMIEHRKQMQNYSLQDSRTLAGSADRLSTTGNPYTRRMWLLAQKYLISTLWTSGKLGQAYDVANRAQLRLHASPFHSLFRLQIEVELWRIRTYLVASKTSDYKLERRLHGLESIYQQAKDCGSIIYAVDALVAMTECYAFGRNHDAALQTGRLAVKRSRETGSDILASQTIVDVAVRLLATDHWRVALALITRNDIKHGLGSYRRDLLRHAFALGALRAGGLQKAKHWSRIDQSSVPPTVRLRQGIVNAQALYRLGDLTDARSVAAETLENAEKLGSSPVLREAYEMAGIILKKPKLISSAEEIARILAA